MDIESKVIYKVFSRGTYLGLLPTPRNPFAYGQDINTGATELLLFVPQTIDNASADLEYLTDEAGNYLTDEAGTFLTTDRATDMVGRSGSNALVANDNDIQAWGYSPDNPNGKLLFAGYIDRWRGIIGTNNDVEVTVTSYGKDLVDYIFGNDAFDVEIDQTNDSGSYYDLGAVGQAAGNVSIGGLAPDHFAQTISSAAFALSKMTIKCGAGSTFLGVYPASVAATLKFYSGSPDGSRTLLSTVVVNVTNPATSPQNIAFVLSSPIQLDAGTTYCWDLESDNYLSVGISSSTNPYPNGKAYIGQGGIYDNLPNNDWTFSCFSGALFTDAEFVATDPSDMIRQAIDGYQAQGGVVSYTVSSIDDTGLAIDYEFKTATVAEIIAKARELSPSNWFWYVDPATQILYFKEPQ